MKVLVDGYIQLEKNCIRCGKVIHTIIPNNLVFWMWEMYPSWKCLWCGTKEEMLAHDIESLREALLKTHSIKRRITNDHR